VLWLVGRHLSGLAGRDLALRCAHGRDGGERRTERKRGLTGESSSRWAGALTRTSNDQWSRGLRNLMDRKSSLERAIGSIEERLSIAVGARRGRLRGYPSQGERFQKQRRLQVLRRQLEEVRARLEAGRISVTRGGRRLVRLRQNLEAAGLSELEWRERWEAERLFLTADGEADKAWGNETIRWHPEEGWLEIRLPTPLAELANRAHGRYRLSCQVSFPHRGDQVAAQAVSGAVRYDISYDSERRRWYLDASWQMARPAVPLNSQTRSSITVSRHHAAAVVIGRRSLGHGARRRPDVTETHRRMLGLTR
jgi:hypothetical protein